MDFCYKLLFFDENFLGFLVQARQHEFFGQQLLV